MGIASVMDKKAARKVQQGLAALRRLSSPPSSPDADRDTLRLPEDHDGTSSFG